MALEIINEIRESENQARKIRQDAAAKAKEIIKKSDESGAQLILKREQEARADHTKIIEEAKTRAEKTAEISAEMENQERVRLYDKAEKALNSAAEFIIEELKKQ